MTKKKPTLQAQIYTLRAQLNTLMGIIDEQSASIAELRSDSLFSAPKAPDPEPLRLEIGKYYKTREGKTVYIYDYTYGNGYMESEHFRAKDSGAYHRSGAWTLKGPHPKDIVAETTKPKTFWQRLFHCNCK